LWSLEDGKELKAFVFNPEDNPPMPPAEKSWQRGDFTPDGKHAVILEKEFLLVVKAENGELAHRWGNYQKGPSFGGDNELLVLPNGKEALVYHGYEVIRINLWTGAWNVVAKKAGDSYIFNLQAIDKQQKFLYVDAPSELAAPDQPPLRITLWDADFKTLVKSRPLPYAGGWLIDPANSILAVFLWHEIKFFSLKDAQLSPIKSPINYDIENSKDIEFSPDGKYLVMVKNTPTGEQLLVWDAPKNQSSK